MFHDQTTLPADQRVRRVSRQRKKRHFLRKSGLVLLLFVALMTATRPFMPGVVRWYVVRAIDRNPLYRGKIGDIDLNLLRGSYTIEDIRLIKLTGQIPYPLFKARRMELAIQWNALFHRKVVGQVVMEAPEINFVDAPSDAEAQTGAGGPWLQMLTDLFPFKINRLEIHDGSIHFRTFQKQQRVDAYLGQLEGAIDNLTNIRDEITPLITTVSARGLAMEQAKFEYEMKLDPFAYRPTFHMAVRLVGLDVTKLNDLARLYGGFDFKSGWFDVVVEVDSRNGLIAGYVKPLLRNLEIFNLPQDVVEDHPLEFVWKAILGTTTAVLKNQPRDQFGTVIPFTGDVASTQPDLLATIGNVLRNGFIRAYLPKFQNGATETEGLQFDAPTLSEPTSAGVQP